MAEAMSIKSMFQSLNTEEVDVIRGRVVSSAPLQIQAENDEKLLIPESLLCVPQHLTSHSVRCDIPEIGDGISITIDNSLKVGDKVFMLSFNKGKKYYIQDKES